MKARQELSKTLAVSVLGEQFALICVTPKFCLSITPKTFQYQGKHRDGLPKNVGLSVSKM